MKKKQKSRLIDRKGNLKLKSLTRKEKNLIIKEMAERMKDIVYMEAEEQMEKIVDSIKVNIPLDFMLIADYSIGFVVADLVQILGRKMRK